MNKTLQKKIINSSTSNSKAHQRIIHNNQLGFILGMKRWFNVRKLVMGVACFVFTLVKSPQEIRMHTVQNRFTEIENKLMVTKVDSGSGARR